MEEKITRKSIIKEIITKVPKAIEIMQSKGLHCIGCPGSAMESLENGAKGHGMNDEDIDSLVEEINKAVEKEQK